MKKISPYIWICFFIIFLACIPRSIEIINKNFLFGFDQGKHWLGAKAIVIDHKIPLIGDEVGGARGFFQGPGWLYVLSILYVLFGGNPYGAIVLTFISGMLAVILSLILFGKTLGKTDSVFIGIFLATSPILIEASRFAWPPHIIPPITVLVLFSVYNIVSGNYKYLPVLAFLTGCMAHFEMATAGTLTLAFIIIMTPVIIFKKIPVSYTVLSIAAWFLPFLPLIVFDLRHQFLNTKGIIGTFTGERQIVKTFDALMSNHLMIFNTGIFHALQTLFIPKNVMGFLLLTGVLQIVDKHTALTRRLFLIITYAIPAAVFGVLMLYKNDLWPWWLYNISVITAVLTGLTVSWFYQKKGILRAGAILVLFLIMAGFVKDSVRFWRNDFPDYGGVHKIRGKIDALDAVYADAKGSRFGLFTFSPPVYTFPYDFLIPWYGKKRYGYIPPQEKLSVFYLLAEPDPEKPWTFKGWMETAVTGGTVVSRITLPSGFIVEKRTMP